MVAAIVQESWLILYISRLHTSVDTAFAWFSQGGAGWLARLSITPHVLECLLTEPQSRLRFWKRYSISLRVFKWHRRETFLVFPTYTSGHFLDFSVHFGPRFTSRAWKKLSIHVVRFYSLVLSFLSQWTLSIRAAATSYSLSTSPLPLCLSLLSSPALDPDPAGAAKSAGLQVGNLRLTLYLYKTWFVLFCTAYTIKHCHQLVVLGFAGYFFWIKKKGMMV